MEQHGNVLPAGEYLIIDACYVYSLHARWQVISDLMFPPRGEPAEASSLPHLGVANSQGTDDNYCGPGGVIVDPHTGAPFAFSCTATGDGAYPDQDDHLYGVDSGTLACLPLAMVDAATLTILDVADPSPYGVQSGRLVTFLAPFACVPCDAKGVIRFGDITIATGPTWDEIEAEDEDKDEA